MTTELKAMREVLAITNALADESRVRDEIRAFVPALPDIMKQETLP